MDALTTTLIIVWLFRSGNWSWIGYPVRYLWLILLIIALVISWKKTRKLPLFMKYTGNQKFSIGIYVILLLVFGFYNVSTSTAHSVNEQTLDLAFPLLDGAYYVGHGGDHVLLNYHHAHPPQKYALDIVGINKWGARASGLYPEDLEKYVIYGATLYSPCTGRVTDMHNTSPDLTPPDSDPDHPVGNHVALACDGHDAIVYLAHMQEGSVLVQMGDEVQTGQPLGKVGNSGNTSEPHLHIHAELDGKGVPLTFDGRFLVRNQIVR
ncbi:cell wall endopeptidase [Bacillus sp. OxB-1]|uniref:M23 family metallopeptidase n=1 Tax=Bacillus sp. (strain OxB-1) TaxID=98228 RepID=UPI0005820C05|nr:M23 family metallopeptidase [Bacillus sp. OxB-1]BAQ08854.1 cell wall endopeptidase [Bacillus sp. OxB-1]